MVPFPFPVALLLAVAVSQGSAQVKVTSAESTRELPVRQRRSLEKKPGGQNRQLPPEGVPRKLGPADGDLRKLEILIRDLARDHIPHRYEKKSGWGDQVERWDGLHVQLKGLRLLTKRRKKMVNHGTWKKYSAELVDPDRDFQFRLNSLRKNANGKWIVHFSVTAELRLFGRLSEWIKGVQLISVSVDAQANVTLDVVASVGSRLDFSKVPPDLFLEPRVSQAKLTVNRFRVDRVSKAGGEIAQQVGRGVRAILDDKIGSYQKKLVEKMNQSLERKRDDLKLSLSELVDSSWSDLLGGLKQDVSPEDR